MTTSELLNNQIGYLGSQLRQVLDDTPEFAQDYKLTPQAMSPRETAEHLCEAYHALVLLADGTKHEWGTYEVPDKAWGPLLSTMWNLRAQAGGAAGNIKDGWKYIVPHDSYHVGQLVLARMQYEQEWDAHSIYK